MIINIIRKILRGILKKKFRKIGQNVMWDPLTSSINYDNVIIGNNVHMGRNLNLRASHSSIIIGDDVMIAPNVGIYGGNHITNKIGYKMNEQRKSKEWKDRDCKIENDVWIGANVIILEGVTIGEGSIIAAGAVVTQNIGEYCVSVGNPAKVIRKRFDEIDIERHKKIMNDRKK